ncbi:Anp1-domain-containing protein [Lipomyces tetrasporus]|uniref:Anp1-domain-containing protein n=1 Tax=Lipomyces tetrasporus TaxID=54092 RepID=A0AAD7QSF9_9ASCO|nr:Anp1-domain-containing protein [Lipomyces tetrasporus]KAJ8100684.1 Anp1-domain-containing protein [Lipomyces tetrasporus]
MNGNPFPHTSQTFNISPHRFQPRSKNQFLRRQPSKRLLLLLCPVAVVLLFLFPTLRTLAIPTLGSSIFRDDPLITTVHHYDLSRSTGTGRGWERGERVLMCIPLRDAAQHLPMMFSHLRNLTYPHSLIDMAFLVSDSKDETLLLLNTLLERQQSDKDPYQRFGHIDIFEKDFGQVVGQGFSDRHGFAAQGPRRKLMARARNWLLSTSLRPEHSWVYWRDADIEVAPPTVIEDLMRHNKDVIVPSRLLLYIWRPLPDWLGGEQPYDLNSWQESETAMQLAQTLSEDAVIVEGYPEYATWRPHLAYLRDPYGDPDVEMEIDGVGGVSILAKAKVFRAGSHFPAFSFERHAETEGFGKMCKRMGFSVVGLPHYVIWHMYEPSVDDIRHMAEMEQERLRKETEAQEAAGKEKADGGGVAGGAAGVSDSGDSPLKEASQEKDLLAMYENGQGFLDSVRAAELRAAKQVKEEMKQKKLAAEKAKAEEAKAEKAAGPSKNGGKKGA